MERNEDDENLPDLLVKDEESVLRSNFVLDHVGQVILTLNVDGLSWRLLETFDNQDGSTCLGIKLAPKVPNEIIFSDVYAVDYINYSSTHQAQRPNARRYLLGHDSEMYRFAVHGFQRSKTQPSLWTLAVYTFGHKVLQTCQLWMNQINACLRMEVQRPKNLLVFVHPMSGKGNGCRNWDIVAPIFTQAKVKTKVIVTQRAGHAFDVMASIATKELKSYDGVVAVGGDGLFNEILNGLFSSRLKLPYPPAPIDFLDSIGKNDVHDSNDLATETSSQNEGQSFLLPSLRGTGDLSCNTDEDSDFSLPNEQFRFGIIPSGSTDAIVLCTTGARDPITSALHIVLGKRVRLDIAQIVKWKTTSTSEVEPCIRYAASFAGYGFYGDVITESEKYRWMGPKRYDYAGTKVFLRHRSYEAEISYLEVESEKDNSLSEKGRLGSNHQASQGSNKSERIICRVNCNVCNEKPVHISTRVPYQTPYSDPEKARWLRSSGTFLSIGAAVISNRNERAPDGLVVDAHLSDGYLHLILIKDCPRAFYLWHLTQLAKRGGKPLNFEFVEHHKTTAFTFTSSGNESVWNLDGEIFKAHKLSAQVFRGLVCLFASGPEV